MQTVAEWYREAHTIAEHDAIKRRRRELQNSLAMLAVREGSGTPPRMPKRRG